MNKSRRMVTQTARALAGDGWRVVQPDLYGCGDSAGDFSQATWQEWVADLQRILHASCDSPGDLWLWGVRAGALLLPPLLETHFQANLLLWQPVTDGAQALNQFLRLRTSSAMLSGEAATDRKRFRDQLIAGEALAVAGYLLSPPVANGLAAARFDVPTGYSGRIVWLEVVSDAEQAVPAATERLLASWRAAGRTVAFERVLGPPFWQTVEIADVPELVTKTREVLRTQIAATSAPGLEGMDRRTNSN
jgi:exosortase A-associated hydrolase 2